MSWEVFNHWHGFGGKEYNGLKRGVTEMQAYMSRKHMFGFSSEQGVSW